MDGLVLPFERTIHDHRSILLVWRPNFGLCPYITPHFLRIALSYLDFSFINTMLNIKEFVLDMFSPLCAGRSAIYFE